MNIDAEYVLTRVFTLPEANGVTNVVRKVLWEIIFFDTDNPEEVRSTATVETYMELETVDPNNYVEFDLITKTQILEWCLADVGGTTFLDKLLAGGHERMLYKALDDMPLVERDVEIIQDV